MRTLARIATALEMIAEELHVFNAPSKPVKESKPLPMSEDKPETPGESPRASAKVLRRSWTEAEDRKLLDAYRKGYNIESFVRSELRGRTPASAYSRYRKLYKEGRA